MLDRALTADLKAEMKTEVDDDAEEKYLEIAIQAGRSNVRLRIVAASLRTTPRPDLNYLAMWQVRGPAGVASRFENVGTALAARVLTRTLAQRWAKPF